MNKKYKNKYYPVIIFLILFLIFNNFPVGKLTEILKFLPFGLEKAEAVQVTIDNNVTTSDNALQRAPNVVFVTTSTIGYTFGVDSDGTCAYWKTTNGGLSWGTAVQITSQTDCVGTTIWYDQWTPGDSTGKFIHIVFGDYGDDDLWYERINTADDSQLGEVSAVSNSSQGGMITASSSISIVKGTDGDLYVGTASNADSYIVKCTTTCGTAGNWTEAGTNPMDLNYDEIILLPLASSSNIMLINWDLSANSVRSQNYVDATNGWYGAWLTIGSATDAAAYMHAFDATLNLSSNTIYLAVINAQNSTSGDIDFYIYTTKWAAATDPIANTRMRGVAVGFNQLDGTVAVVALTGATGGTIAFKKSSNGATAWSGSTTLNSDTGSGHSSVSLNMNATYLYAVWKDTTNEDLSGNSLDAGLLQLAYRWQNDNNAPNSNANMTTSASVATTTQTLGQRLTVVIQVGNNGMVATTTAYALQFTTDVPTSTTATWTDVGPYTAIGYATGTAADSAAITATLCGAPGSLGWSNGAWYEIKNTSGNITQSAGAYTELAFMVTALYGAANTKYYLRLTNPTSRQVLAGYANFPTIVTASTNAMTYSWEPLSVKPTTNASLQSLFDDLEYYRSVTADNLYATTSDATRAPFHNFFRRNSNSTDNISVSWEGNSSLACDASRYLVLEVYNFTTSGWQSKATSTDCLVGTDFPLSTTISSGLSSFYSSNWTYWRVYHNYAAATLLTDSISITFSSGSLSLSAPTSVTFNSYTLNGVGYSAYTFATGTEQIIVTDSGIGSGWTLSGTCTNWQDAELHTIDNGNLLFRSDGTLGTEPTIVFSNYSTAGVTEGTNNQDFNASVTLVTAGDGNGVGIYYIQPSFELYIYATSTYTGAYSATLTLTLARNNETLPFT